MANLLEQYKTRLAVAEKVYGASHNGAALPASKKLATAKCLQNVERFMNEAFDNSVGTQRSDMGAFKKFSMNLTNVVLPNLIAHDLVIVHPMSAMSGYVSYLEYTAGSNKGKIAQGHVFNSPFGLGDVDPNYTSSQVAQDFTFGESTTTIAMTWKPVVPGSVKIVNGEDTYYDNGKGGLMKNPTSVSRRVVNVVEEDGRLAGTDAKIEVVFVGGSEAGSIEYAGATAGVTLTTGITGATTVTYTYNNVVIPQNDLPVLNAEVKALPLIAKARRIAIYYSQIAAFQAKTDYGFDLGDQLAEKAVGQLSYEIDTEVVNLLVNNATVEEAMEFDKTVPAGISKAQHYEGFAETVAVGRQLIYDRTKRFAPNYMLIASNILPVLGFLKGWTAAPASSINGPYFAGTLDGLKVFVSPSIPAGKFVLGVNGDDMMSSAAVYAPYMAIVPTQLLQYSDGGTTQGWSTMYDLRLLNKNLLVAGTVVGGGVVAGTASSPIHTAA